MRRRSRRTMPVHRELEAPATNSRRNLDVHGTSREALDQAVRALARLLARQAARELFERECAHNVNQGDPP